LINGKQFQGITDLILNQLAANNIESIELISAPSAKFDAEGKQASSISSPKRNRQWMVC
jgi:hypothetical protein